MFSFPLRVDYCSAFLLVFFFPGFILRLFFYIIYSVLCHPSGLLQQVLLLSRFGSIAKDSHEKGSWKQGGGQQGGEARDTLLPQENLQATKHKLQSHSKDLVGFSF